MIDFVREWDEIFLSRDDYLLQKVIPSRSIKRMIDYKKFNITRKYCSEQSYLKNIHDPKNFLAKPVDNRVQPDINNQDENAEYLNIDNKEYQYVNLTVELFANNSLCK